MQNIAHTSFFHNTLAAGMLYDTQLGAPIRTPQKTRVWFLLFHRVEDHTSAKA